MLDLAGLYPPIPTPFDAHERVDHDRFAENVARWLALPLDGLVMPGSNSEAVALSREERLALWQQTGALLKGTGKRFIAGTGAETTAETIALTEAAAAAGAVATLVVPPFFYKAALTPEVLIGHFRALADASPIPVLVYNVPAYTGMDLPTRLFVELAEHPNIIGAKDSSANVVKLGEILAQRPDFQVFAGTGSALLPFLSVGAAGSIAALANVAAAPMAELSAAFKRGDWQRAKTIQLALVELNSAITARYGVAGLKYTLDQLGYYGGPPRRPLQLLGSAGRNEIDQLLAKLAAQGFALRAAQI